MGVVSGWVDGCMVKYSATFTKESDCKDPVAALGYLDTWSVVL